MFEIIDEIRPRVKERASIRERVFTWLGAICFLSLLLIATVCPIYALAEEIPVHVFERQGLLVRLMPGPCVDPVSVALIQRAIPPQFHSRFKAVESVWPEKDGTFKPYAGCWAEFSGEEADHTSPVIFTVFSDGSSGVVEKSIFTKKAGVGV
jgi:hypothetical protein